MERLILISVPVLFSFILLSHGQEKNEDVLDDSYLLNTIHKGSTKSRTFYDYQTRVVAYKDLIESRCLLEVLKSGESFLGQNYQKPFINNLSKHFFMSENQLSKRQIYDIGGQRISDFCRGFPTFLIQELKANEQEFNNNSINDNVAGREKRSTKHFFVGRVRGQTQSQYLNFGNSQEPGKAEAESTYGSSKAVVTGSSGMGQAQSQSNPYGCEDCYGQAAGPVPPDEQQLHFERPGLTSHLPSEGISTGPAVDRTGTVSQIPGQRPSTAEVGRPGEGVRIPGYDGQVVRGPGYGRQDIRAPIGQEGHYASPGTPGYVTDTVPGHIPSYATPQGSPSPPSSQEQRPSQGSRYVAPGQLGPPLDVTRYPAPQSQSSYPAQSHHVQPQGLRPPGGITYPETSSTIPSQQIPVYDGQPTLPNRPGTQLITGQKPQYIPSHPSQWVPADPGTQQPGYPSQPASTYVGEPNRQQHVYPVQPTEVYVTQRGPGHPAQTYPGQTISERVPQQVRPSYYNRISQTYPQGPESSRYPTSHELQSSPTTGTGSRGGQFAGQLSGDYNAQAGQRGRFSGVFSGQYETDSYGQKYDSYLQPGYQATGGKFYPGQIGTASQPTYSDSQRTDGNIDKPPGGFGYPSGQLAPSYISGQLPGSSNIGKTEIPTQGYPGQVATISGENGPTRLIPSGQGLTSTAPVNVQGYVAPGSQIRLPGYVVGPTDQQIPEYGTGPSSSTGSVDYARTGLPAYGADTGTLAGSLSYGTQYGVGGQQGTPQYQVPYDQQLGGPQYPPGSGQHLGAPAYTTTDGQIIPGYGPVSRGQTRIPGQQTIPGYDETIRGPAQPAGRDEYIGRYDQYEASGGQVDDSDSQVQTSVQQTNNETQASASAQGKHAGGTAQSQVSGTYAGSGSFSASAGSDDGKRGALTQVSGGKEGALSAAQGRGGLGQSQAQVQLSSDTGDTISNAQTNGYNHGSQTQVQASGKGGMADAQSNGPGSTSSQAQIGFTPYDESEKDDQTTPFRGGGMASAQSGTYTGQTQSQIQGKFQYGIRYIGAAQAGSGGKDAVALARNQSRPTGLSGTFPEFKPLTFTPAKPSVQTQQMSHSRHKKTMQKTNSQPQAQESTMDTVVTSPDLDEPSTEDYPDEEYDYTGDISTEKAKTVISQKSGSQSQHIILDPVENIDATVHQSSDGFPEDGTILQPGEYIPGSPGYQIPLGFRGKVKSISYGPNTYTSGKNSQAQTVTLTPGTGRIIYKQPVYAVSSKTHMQNGRFSYGSGYTYQPVTYQLKSGKSLPNFVSVTRSETGSKNPYTGQKTPSVSYTQASSCGLFTNTCVFNGTGKLCIPKAKTNPDGTLISC